MGKASANFKSCGKEPVSRQLFFERNSAKMFRTLCRLVIFPMSENNTFETSDFADLPSLFEVARVPRSLPQCYCGKNYCET